MKKYAISDIHGSYNEMMKLFDYSKFDPSCDQLVVVGDMIDRGLDSGKVLKEIRGLQQNYSAVHATVGNHEEMMLWYVDNIQMMWMNYGGYEAANSINEVFKDEGVSSIVQWVRDLPIYFEDERFIYAHAGIDPSYLTNKNDREVLWMLKKDFYEMSHETMNFLAKGKAVVHGHTPDSKVTFDGVRVSIDLGAQVIEQPKLALVELEEMVYYEYNFSSDKITKKQ